MAFGRGGNMTRRHQVPSQIADPSVNAHPRFPVASRVSAEQPLTSLNNSSGESEYPLSYWFLILIPDTTYCALRASEVTDRVAGSSGRERKSTPRCNNRPTSVS